jgi:hypothetical protein
MCIVSLHRTFPIVTSIMVCGIVMIAVRPGLQVPVIDNAIVDLLVARIHLERSYRVSWHRLAKHMADHNHT